MATVYLPVTERINLTSEERAKGISRELYNLKLPKHLHEPGRTTTMLLATIQHPDTGQWACVGDTDLSIVVHPQRDLNALVALFPQLTTEERSAMTYYIATSEVVLFQYLMPSDSEVLTQEQAEAAGWFGDSL
jgi:hypothetical protein